MPTQQEKKMMTLTTNSLVFICVIFILSICFFGLLSELIQLYHTKHPQSTFLSYFFHLSFTLIYVYMLKQVGFPLKRCGFNINNWQRQISSSLLITILFCAFITLVKYVLLITLTTKSHPNLISIGIFDNDFYHTSMPSVILYSLFYIAFVPLQSFLANGVIQSLILDCTTIKYKVFLSCAASTVFFASLHLQFDYLYALIMFVPGACWSYMYARQRSLLGISISHSIIGVYAFIFLGLDHFISSIHTSFSI